jgi:hypothetical protein
MCCTAMSYSKFFVLSMPSSATSKCHTHALDINCDQLLRRRYGSQGLTCTVVSPGAVNSDIWRCLRTSCLRPLSFEATHHTHLLCLGTISRGAAQDVFSAGCVATLFFSYSRNTH